MFNFINDSATTLCDMDFYFKHIHLLRSNPYLQKPGPRHKKKVTCHLRCYNQYSILTSISLDSVCGDKADISQTASNCGFIDVLGRVHGFVKF